jgi:hypothetical protein
MGQVLDGSATTTEAVRRAMSGCDRQTLLLRNHNELRAHLIDFVDAYNLARRLNTLKGITPYDFVCKAWTSHPQRFTISPLQKMPRLNS